MRIEVWSHPEDDFRQLLTLNPTELTLSVGEKTSDTATLTLPTEYAFSEVQVDDEPVRIIDLLVHADPTSPEDSKSSVLVVFDDAGNVDYEFMLEEVDENLGEEGQGLISLSARSLLGELDSGVVHPRNPPAETHWLWGSDKNLLRNGWLTSESIPNPSAERGITAPFQGTVDDGVFGPASVAPSLVGGDADTGSWVWLITPGSTPDAGGVAALSGLVEGQEYEFGFRLKDASASARFRATIVGAASASHTNAYQENEYWWAELGNATQGNGNSNGTWQSTLFKFIAASSTVTVYIVCADPTGPPFQVDTLTLDGNRVGLEPWEPWAWRTVGAMVNKFSRTGLHAPPDAPPGAGSIVIQGVDAISVDPWGGPGRYGNMGGRQQATVEPGRVHHGTAWVYQESGSPQQLTILIQRLAPSGPIAEAPAGWAPLPGSHTISSRGVTVPSHTWTQFPPLEFVSDVPSANFHFRWVGSPLRTDDGPKTSPDLYLSGFQLIEGFPPSTVGDISIQLLTHAQSRGTLVWLEPSFTATHDSNNEEWDEPVGFLADVGELYGTHVLTNILSMGYRADIRRHPEPHGTVTHQLHLYNPGSLPTAVDQVIVGALTGGHVATRRLAHTHLLCEADDGSVTEVTLPEFAGLPRREGYLRAEHALNSTAARKVGEAQLADDLTNLLAVQSQKDGYPKYRPGWKLGHSLGHRGGHHTRTVSTLTIQLRDGEWTTETTASRYVTDDAARDHLISSLVDQFRRLRRPTPAIASSSGGDGGGDPTILVAASNASEWSKNKADSGFVSQGGDDTAMIVQAIQQAGAGRVVLSEGDFTIASHLRVGQVAGYSTIPAHVHGVGEGLTRITVTDPHSTNGGILVPAGSQLSDVTVLNGQAAPGGGPGLVVAIGTIRRVTATSTSFQTTPAFNITGTAVDITASSDGSNTVTGTVLGGVFAGPISLPSGSAVLKNITTGLIHATGGTQHHITGWTVPTGRALILDGAARCHIQGLVRFPFGTDPAILLINADDNLIDLTVTSAVGDICVVTDSDRNRIRINGTWSTGITTNTRDGIRLEGTSSGNDIRNSTFVGRPTSNQPRAGVNIVDATCEDNIVVANDFGSVTDYATAPIIDASSSTILTWPADPTYGDNFT